MKKQRLQSILRAPPAMLTYVCLPLIASPDLSVYREWLLPLPYLPPQVPCDAINREEARKMEKLSTCCG